MTHNHPDHIVNPELLRVTRDLLRAGMQKRAFVPGGGGGDPAAGGGAPPDPAAGGGAPPMDPAMMGGGGGMPMDPAMMGMPPPPSGGGGGGDPAMMAKLDQLLQAIQGGNAGSPQTGAAAGGGLKPKIDVNVEIMQIKHMLAKIIDSMGIPVSAQEMVATPEKLNAMAAGQQASGQQDASMGGGGQGAIPPMQPMQGAAPPGGGPGGGGAPPGGAKQGSDRYSRGTGFDTSGLGSTASRAAIILKMRQQGAAA